LIKELAINRVRLPLVSITLMVLFVVGGSVMLLVKWPAGPGSLDWGVLILCYLGYVFLMAASLLYVKTNK